MPQNIWTTFIAESGSKVLVDSSPDGKTWTGTRYFNQTSPYRPALASYDGKLYLAYITNDVLSGTQILSDRIFLCTTSDGLCWAPTIFFNQYSKCTPALAVFGDSLFMAYVSNDSTNRILYTSFTAATGWAAAKDTGHFSPQSPALVEYGGNLQMVFISNDGKSAIRHCAMSPAGSWGSSSDTGQTTAVPPAVAVFNNDLYVAFVANDSAKIILISSASNWQTTTDTNQTASWAPSLATFNDGGNKLFVGFPGESNSECLLTSSSNPSTASSWPSSATDIRQRSQSLSGLALAIAPFASGPQPPPGLSCLRAGAAGPRVYYRDQVSGFLREGVVANGNAQPTPAWAGSSKYPAACGGGISCLYKDDTGARVYYLDPGNHIIELSLNQDLSVGFISCAETADPHSPLSCLLAGSSGTRVYYTATQNGKTQVYEVPFLSIPGIVPEGPSVKPTSFSPTALGTIVTPVPAQRNSPLTCQYIDDFGSRVYYKDPTNQIIELALNYPPAGLVASFNPTGFKAAAGGLTCLLAGSAGMRVYYLDGSNYVRELTIVNGVVNQTPLAPGANKARAGSALTCLYIPDVGSRVYYVSHENNEVWEWGLTGGANTFTPSDSDAAADSPLTCLYIGGSGSRVYYMKDDGNIYELAFNGGNGFFTGASLSTIT